jgi:two-component system LytT family response regulator
MLESRDPIRVVVVDDEPLARDCVRLALRQDPSARVVAECGNGRSALAAIRRHEPDLVFLDVQMPGLDGFGVVETLGPERMPAVVFVTAYDSYALRAFRLHALDYLLKPFDDERFGETLLHARRCLEQARDGRLAERLAALVRDRAPEPAGAPDPGQAFATRILIRRSDRLEFLPLASVDWIEAAGNYVRVHAGPRAELVRVTLAALLDRLDPSMFSRIHRSVVVNVGRVREMHPWYGGDYNAVLADGQELRVSRRYREALLRTLS